MFLKNLKISAQLFIGFGSMFLFVVALSVISYIHSNLINSQTETMYNHPFQVQRAIGTLEKDIYQMRLSTRNLMIYTSAKQQRIEVDAIDNAAADVIKQFEIIQEKYLGDKAEFTNAYNAFVKWETVRKDNTDRILNGDIDTAKESVLPDGDVGILRADMLAKIKILDNFASQKAISLYENSTKLHEKLTIQLYLFTFLILLSILVIGWLIINSIRNPIKHFIKVIEKFQGGNHNVSSKINNKNEFGVLSEAFNAMIESIRGNYELNEKTNILVDSMMANDNAHSFFREMLPKLAELSNSQMAAVFILTDDKKSFNHYESIGLTSEFIKMSFDAYSFEGEFGPALNSHQIQHVKNIPIDTSFVYQTVSGKFIPREIVTIPIVVSNEVIAIISLASVRKYSDEANRLIDSLYNILSARVEGILSYRKIRKFSNKMEIQNNELSAQKVELDAQGIELREQNRELEIQKNILEEANKLKTHFLSNMSHELRTPLNSVIALSGVLNRRLKSKIPAEESNYIEVIERNGKHLLTLINDILDISRIEAGKEEVEITNFSTENLLEEVLEMIRPQADQKKIELIQKNNRHKVYINSDYNKCRHILQNLIANAIKFTEKGKVEIEIIEEKDEFEIKVIDTGIGISAENLEKIFDEFRQADSSTSRRYGGTGLGLAIAKKYANLLGGTVKVQSSIDQGSVFTLTLPINYSEDKRVIEKPVYKPLSKPTTLKKLYGDKQKTILLVDDSEPAIIQMKDFLQESGYEILTAQNGKEALDTISQTIPDAIILDLMMPGIDGFNVLQTIRNAETTAQIPVLILTAKHITKEDLNFLTKNNVHQLIQKGDINREELLRAINDLYKTGTNEELNIVQKKNKKTKEKLNILVVEDNSDNMLTVRAILEDIYIIYEATDGTEAIELANKYKPDLILMDIALPGIDGIEAFKTIRMNGELAHIPIIALTASAMTSDRETILASGFDAYISKPIDENEFFGTINRVLYGA